MLPTPKSSWATCNGARPPFERPTETSMSASDHSVLTRLPVEERLALVEETWDSIAADSGAVPLTDAQRSELEKRIAEDDTNPDDIIPWGQVKASTLSRIRK